MKFHKLHFDLNGMENLKIKIISFENNLVDNYKMISFGVDAENPQKYLILQRTLFPDEQDIYLGLDGYYLEINDQSNSGYSVCDKVILKDNSLTFYFNKKFEVDNLVLDLSETFYDKENLNEYLFYILKDVLAVEK